MKEQNGEHPIGDSGQLILLVLFLLIWVVDSFFLQISTFLSDYVSLYIRLVMLGLLLVTAVYLIRSGHAVVQQGQLPSGIVATGAFRYVRHPLYLGSIVFYHWKFPVSRLQLMTNFHLLSSIGYLGSWLTF